ncbi:hypothetical protein TTHERM_000227039 (macronuclear) [Tetrahymena thermophila SB210]|uniref:Uncharacterized protein n=1 Tax=Tetrahymena thermophila (strain SB210) TaxID=312017 RepID=W7XIK8_TETTS|nr:hypothetical protein TTHERM_000227039 [Tetrahymena thermophila SB210]EWS74736.1 hypothetical protein TTHERM_000227039 [Tetrahymena thermophila SB210]|eukprot:XP_012652737.1 hypothetical protein TTHERM_000227039 [Tetrahymena thermophila SB210]
MICCIKNLKKIFCYLQQGNLVVDTGTSQAVPHLSTNPALRRLTSEFEWDPVFSPQYGRQQNQLQTIYIYYDQKDYFQVVDTGTSQAVPHLSTNPALRRLTSEFEWDPVFSPQYGRQQNQ